MAIGLGFPWTGAAAVKPAPSPGPVAAEFTPVLVDRFHPLRSGLEAYIADVYLQRYQARLSYFLDILIGFRDSRGHWVAAVGFTPLAHRGAFSEQYLDVPVERLVAAAEAQRSGSSIVSRWDLVEVGNLAAESPGMARKIIQEMTRYLYRRRFRWVVFTATRSLKNAFKRLGFEPVALQVADPARLGPLAEQWGSYYSTDPQVMYADTDKAYACMFPET
ncbi:thermostable hemolysin [beta proteobacterium MWH-UniP1]